MSETNSQQQNSAEPSSVFPTNSTNLPEFTVIKYGGYFNKDDVNMNQETKAKLLKKCTEIVTRFKANGPQSFDNMSGNEIAALILQSYSSSGHKSLLD